VIARDKPSHQELAHPLIAAAEHQQSFVGTMNETWQAVLFKILFDLTDET